MNSTNILCIEFHDTFGKLIVEHKRECMKFSQSTHFKPYKVTHFELSENMLRWTNPFAPTHNEKLNAWQDLNRRKKKILRQC